VVRLAHGRLVEDIACARESRPRIELARDSSTSLTGTGSPPRDAFEGWRAPGKLGEPRPASLVLSEVGHVYAYDTVWERRALQHVTLSVDDGEGLLFAGDNGSGKSTLAWIIAGLLRPTNGACLLDGIPIHRRRASVAIAFQHARLQLQRPTVGEDIADGAGWLSETRHADGDLDVRIAGALRAVGLDPELAPRSIEQLSGGQQRRVAIAGLLARGPRVLVLDEPLAGLDAPTRSGLADLLVNLRERAGLTVIVVSHDPEPLAAACPRVVRLDRGRITGDTGRSALASSLESTAA
jgi:energy-coupling factor transport system ATP-binding protein